MSRAAGSRGRSSPIGSEPDRSPAAGSGPDAGAGVVAGIDVGGTFTDLIIVDERDGSIEIGKTPSTPADQSAAVLEVLRAAHRPVDGIDLIVHGTTVTTNAVLERKLARTGLITTRGFGDVLELGRRTRPTPYGLFGRFVPLIPRPLRREVDERIDAAGRVRRPLDEAELRAAVRSLLEAGCESLVIHFLHAYRNPAHEREAERIARSLWPDDNVTAGHALVSEAREYERGVTAAVNAAVRPVLERYLERLRTALDTGGYARDFLVMNGNGGTVSSRLVSREAARTVMSGPASGVIAAAHAAARAGADRLITYDMGGTSTDVALVRDGRPLVTDEMEIEYAMPVHLPMVDVRTVGAGGGSIARIDAAGLIAVGPRSAGANPGPICYDKGGTEPTITDANVLLGRLDVARLSGMDAPATHATLAAAFERDFGAALGTDPAGCAEAVLRVADLRMAGTIRMVSVAKGHDPRDFTLFAFGGAGPLHAVSLARELGVPRVMLPPRPGIANAIGCVVADLRHDHVATVGQALEESEPGAIRDVLAAQAASGRAALARESVRTVRVDVEHAADMQFAGQTHLVRVALPDLDGEFGAGALRERFEAAWFARFRVRLEGVRVMLVNLRTTVVGVRRPLGLDELIPAAGRGASLDEALVERRPVRFDGAWHDTPVYRRERLPLDVRGTGPAVFEQLDATTLVPPGDTFAGDAFGNLIVTLGGSSEPSASVPSP